MVITEIEETKRSVENVVYPCLVQDSDGDVWYVRDNTNCLQMTGVGADSAPVKSFGYLSEYVGPLTLFEGTLKLRNE